MIHLLFGLRNVRFAPYLVATGGAITQEGDYKVHRYLSGSEPFNISDAPMDATVQVWLVGGGGGAGVGGGGGGGIVYRAAFPVSVGDHTIHIGIGGAPQINGGDTDLVRNETGLLLKALGGGGGDSPGGCGGGGVDNPGHAGLQPGSIWGGYGNQGGNWRGSGLDGGGGGAGTAGVNSSGGVGLGCPWDGFTYSAGGTGKPLGGFEGPANTGNGGSWNSSTNGGWPGGSGIAMIRYLSPA